MLNGLREDVNALYRDDPTARVAGTVEREARLHFDHYNLPDPLRRYLDDLGRRIGELEGEVARLSGDR